jgi:hypothetical protein
MTRTLLLVLAGAFVAAAQSPTFSYRAENSAAPVNVGANGTIQFGSVPTGQTARLSLTAVNGTADSWTLTRVTLGGSSFRETSRAPVTLRPGESYVFDLSFTAEGRGAGSGTLSLEFRTGERTVTFPFLVAATAIAPDLVFSYLLPGGNQTAVAEGERMAFGNTTVGQTATATIFITNRGNGPATVTRVQAAGSDAFRVSGLPLLPSDIAGDRDLRFSVIFAPTSGDEALGFIRIDTSSGSRTILLQGRGTAATFAWVWKSGNDTTNVSAGGQLRLPDTPVGSPVSAVLTVRNGGNAEGRIAQVSVTGTGFALGDLPVLPATVAPGASVDIPVTFTPREAGAAAGRLRIDNMLFDLTGSGLGSKLQYSALLASGSVAMSSTTMLTFPNTGLGKTSEATVAVENSGNADATVASVSVSGSSFKLDQLPALPVRIPAGEKREFRLRFTPDALDSITGALLIDDQRFNLRGSGTAPEPLGNVEFRNVGDTAGPLQQPAVSLSLSKPTQIPLNGRLTLTFNSDSFSDDRTIQFATGGRTVDFRIPADSTEAIFGESAKQVLFQAGTVAGQITLSAAFSYGSVNLTPQPAPVKQIAVPRGEPVLRTVQATQKSATALELVISGYATPRSVQRLNLQLTAASGRQLSTTNLTADVESAFGAWYANSASATFGSQFTASLTLSVSGDVSAIQSVSVSAANQNGTSNTVTATLRQ